MTDYVAVSRAGRALGEDASDSKLTNRDIVTMRRLRSDDPAHWTFRRLGEAFDCSPRYAEKICKYEKRHSAPYEFRRVKVHVKCSGHDQWAKGWKGDDE